MSEVGVSEVEQLETAARGVLRAADLRAVRKTARPAWRRYVKAQRAALERCRRELAAAWDWAREVNAQLLMEHAMDAASPDYQMAVAIPLYVLEQEIAAAEERYHAACASAWRDYCVVLRRELEFWITYRTEQTAELERERWAAHIAGGAVA